jgi:hypothetical protein
MTTSLTIEMYLDDDNQTDVKILIYQYDYEPGRHPNFRGSPDNWDPGYGSVAYIHSYQIVDAPPGKHTLEESELDRLEKLIIEHHEDN